jgi:hypothetical protein
VSPTLSRAPTTQASPARPRQISGPARPGQIKWSGPAASIRWNASPPGVSGRPLGGGRAKIENSSRPHPRKFGQKRFLAVRRSWRGNGVACFWATSLEEIIGGVIAIISFRQEEGCSSLPCRGVLSFRSGAREASGSETPRVHNVARWCGGVAGRGARSKPGKSQE